MQSLVNRHLQPRPTGALLRLRMRPSQTPMTPVTDPLPLWNPFECMCVCVLASIFSDRIFGGVYRDDHSLWRTFGRRPSVRGVGCRSPTSRSTQTALMSHPVWQEWFAALLRSLGPTALRLDRLRTYCGYLHRLLEGLECHTQTDVETLEPERVVGQIVQQHTTASTRRLCHTDIGRPPRAVRASHGTTSQRGWWD